MFPFEEIQGIEDETIEDESTYFDSFSYDSTIGLIAGVDYNPDTGEIYDEGTQKLENLEEDLPF